MSSPRQARPMSSCKSSWDAARRVGWCCLPGIHGDERAGVEALCEWLESHAYMKFLHRWHITLLPCLNPWGYEHGTRENGDGRDLNREFNSSHPPQEVRFVQSVLQQQFDLSLELHADEDSRGYYLYETVQPGADIGNRVLERIPTSMPVNRDATIDGKSANGGVITRPLEPATHGG